MGLGNPGTDLGDYQVTQIIVAHCIESHQTSSFNLPYVFFSPSDNDTIYWVDMGMSTISRAKRDQTWREDVVTNGIGRVEGIAVDWIAGVAA